MASAANSSGDVRGRIDRSGRLVDADPELARLQQEAGSALGQACALPQLAAVARLAFRLGIAVERPALVAGNDRDIDLWVRAVPDGDEVALTLQRWSERPASPSRLSLLSIASGEAPISDERHLWSIDPELRIQSMSPEFARELAVDPKEVAGLPLTRVLQLVEDTSGDMPLLSALAGRRAFTGQRARSRGEQPRELTLEGEVAQTADGGFAGFEGRALFSDTRRVSPPTLSARPPVDTALDDVLRSPLDRIIADAEKITNRSDGPLRSDYASYGNDIVAAARHLLSVIEAMGDDPGFAQGQIDLAALAAEAVMLADPVAEERKVAITLVPSAPVPAGGDERAVIQILVNLITNAVRHSPEGGEVSLEFQTDAAASSVSVRDQGPGIDAADQVRIFEKFEQVDSASGGGSGLGLAIARRLARSMGGDVTVDSAAGAGARFTLSLPPR